MTMTFPATSPGCVSTRSRCSELELPLGLWKLHTDCCLGRGRYAEVRSIELHPDLAPGQLWRSQPSASVPVLSITIVFFGFAGQTTVDVVIPYGFVTGQLEIPILGTQVELLLASEAIADVVLWSRNDEQAVSDTISSGVRGVTFLQWAMDEQSTRKHPAALVELGSGAYSFTLQ